MRRLLLAAVLAALLVSAGCASTYSIPREELDRVDALGTALYSRFVKHYRTLYEQGRAPTAEEFGYWTAKHEQVLSTYEYLKAQLRAVDFDRASLFALLEKLLVLL